MGDEGFEEVNGGQLRAFVERIERLNEEKKALADDIKEVYAEAKANGFDSKILRKIVSIRGQDPDKRSEEETLIDVYLAALNRPFADTPLGGSATERSDDAGTGEKTPAKGAASSKAGAGKPKGRGGFKAEVGAKLHSAISAMGEPAPLTDEEKRKGVSAAFVKPDGTRVSIGTNVRLS